MGQYTAYFQVVSHLPFPYKINVDTYLLPTLLIHYHFGDHVDWYVFIL